MLRTIKIPLLTLVLTVSLVGSVRADCPPGDLSGNCEVDLPDLLIFAGQWLDPPGCVGHPNDCADLDPSNGNGVDMVDFGVLAANWHVIGVMTGSLQVTISPPEAVTAGAQWQVDGGPWRDSGDTESDLWVGSHTVGFNDIDGWTKPGNQIVQIVDGQTTLISGTYIEQTGASLVINEFMASNDSTLATTVDGQEVYPDWIEVYNPTDTAISLDGWYLTDSNSNLTKWQFPDGLVIEPGEFLIVFASNKDYENYPGNYPYVDDANYYHTNFKLDKDPPGEYLALVAADGNTIAHEYTPEYPEQLADISYGLAQYATALVPTRATASYYVPTISDAGTNWTALNFDDSTWDTGETGLGFGAAVTETGEDIGNPSAPGSYSVEDGVYTVQGDGEDIWGATDDFYYVYTPLTGDGEITARVVSIGYTNDWAKAGVMIREELTDTSSHAMMIATPPEGTTDAFSFQWVNGAARDNNIQGGDVTLPAWVRIVRSGNNFTGYYAPDEGGMSGVWVQQGSTTIEMADEVYIGLCVTSHSDGVLCTAVFDNVERSGDIGSDLKEQMLGINASLWARIEFNLEEGEADIFDTLVLRMKYEDGFAAYLNGQKVAECNAPGSLQWNSTALGDRPIEDAFVFETINLMAYLDALQTGTNVLAIHGLNDDMADEEFLVLPELVAAINVSIPQYFTTATPGTFNVPGALGLVADTEFSHDRGFYVEDFNVTITCDTQGATIHYTKDGSTPTEMHGDDYIGPIPIETTTCLRAMAWKEGWLHANVDTQTYIFLDNVIQQPNNPAGFPPSWGSTAADYEMDPDIVTGAEDDAKEALLSIPTISLVTDMDNLFDPSSGIYSNPTQSGVVWERPVSAEWINPDGSTGFQVNCGLRIAGGFSRDPSVTDKHSLRLLFKGIYGPTKLEFPMFDAEDAVERFDTITLRANANDSHGKGGSGGCGYGEAQFIRDEFVRQTQTVMGRPSSHGTFAHLYINGLYWGLYNPVERPAASFAASYFGGDKENYDSLNSGNVKEGDKDAWNTMVSLADSSDEAYQRVQGNNPDGTRNPSYPIYLDVENYIDYMINNHYAGNADWPYHNWYAARYRLADSTGYKFFTWDAEHSIAFPGYIPSPLDLNVTGWSGGVAETYTKIRGNAEFRLLFADYVHRHFFNSGAVYVDPDYPAWDPCTPGRNLPAARYVALADHVEKSVLCECARWGDQTGTTYTLEDWRNERDRVLADYLPYRTDVVLGQYRNINLYPDVNAPVFYINGSYQHGGQTSTGDELTMDNTNGSGTIYYTTDGNDPRLPLALQGTGTTLVAENAIKRVLVPTEDIGTTWKTSLGFDDSTWAVGGTGNGALDFHDSNDYVETGKTASVLGIGGNAARTVTAWVHTRSFNGGGIFEMGQHAAGQDFSLRTLASDNWWRVQYWGDDPVTGDYDFTFDSKNKWVHFAHVHDGTATRVYANGTPVMDEPRTLSTANTKTFKIGRWRDSCFDGLIDDVRIYNVALGASAIQTLANQGTWEVGLIAHWKLDETSGTTASDSAGSNPGTLYGNPTWTESEVFGPGGVGYETDSGYENYIGLDVEAEMYNQNATCYIRIPFTVDACDLNNFNFMMLKMRYDDGFVAYLNGVKVAGVYEPSLLLWNSETDSNGSHEAGSSFDNFDISDPNYIGVLQPGENLLAIHGLNISTTSTDFLISVKLIAGESSSLGDVLSPSAIEYVPPTPVTLIESTHIKARVLDGTTWSALNEATFAVGPVADNLRITEIMYHPQDTGDPNDPNEEFIELKNIGAGAINLALVRFTNGIDFTFPSLELELNEYVVVVKERNVFEAKYGTGINIAGEYSGRLSNAGERICLEDAIGQAILDFEYNDGWRPITDGDGFSLTIIDPTNNDPNSWGEKDSWRASDYVGGSPGDDDPGVLPNPGSVVINEVMAHSHLAADWIELYNTTNSTINIGGWFLSDNDANLMKYRIPDGTTIAGNGPDKYLVFSEDSHFGNTNGLIPFAFSENGEVACLSSADGNVLTGYREVEDFGASETGVSFGRYFKSSTNNYNFVAMDHNTPGWANALPKVGPIVINEIMYHPDWPEGGSYNNDDYEYIELHNITGSAVTLYDYETSEPWKLTDGIDFTFPASPDEVTIPADGYLLVVKNQAAFAWRYPAVPSEKVLGPYDGRLNNAGERVEISMPGDVDTQGVRYYIRIDRVNYSDGSHPEDCPGGIDLWPPEADGGGKSLSRIDSDLYGNDVINWEANDTSPGVTNP